jgi:AraC-like DNA-binding protein
VEVVADAGPVRHFLEYVNKLGLSIDSLEPDLARKAEQALVERFAPANLIIDLMQVFATLSGREDLGMSYASWISISNIGPISTIWEHSPTFRDAMLISKRYLPLSNSLVSIEMFDEDGEVAIVLFISKGTEYGCSQFLEALQANTIRVGRVVLGDNWAPLRIETPLKPFQQMKSRTKFYQCPIYNYSSRYAVICKLEDMLRIRRDVDPFMLSYHQENLEKQLYNASNFISSVESLIYANLSTGTANVAHIAGLIGVSARTLQRQLTNEKTSFAEILDRARVLRAEIYFKEEGKPNLTDLADILGYSNPRSASRFIKARLDSSKYKIRR